MVLGDSFFTSATVATIAPAFTLQDVDDAAMRITQSDCTFIWQVRTNPCPASSSVMASSI
jgi:hypothetical protein